MRNPLDHFGSMVFNDRAMRERLPRETYNALRRTSREGRSLDPAVASVVANAMKDWAIEKGVTHFTHWFQPMTGVTAEKHDSFLSPIGDGSIIMEFSGKELIRGESDASSFPSGGLRATFEARGYTAWDPTSFAFIKDNTLCIPTSFSSYGGESLDMKTPLLRSMRAISRQAKRLLHAIGRKDVAFVDVTLGSEQEYFLIDKEVAASRSDLLYCGRTLLGAKPPKGQEMDDHFFGAIRPRVQAFMDELNVALWRIGVLAKTEHNETAPAQHELAPVYTTANLATDQNQLTMETMKKVAERHGMLCLLHEKPFAGVNGSGKHNNWSLCTDAGENLLDPGGEPGENIQFLLFLSAVIQAADEHQDLLRASAASAGNDLRLGASEAPPAILSVFLGDEIAGILDCIVKGVPFARCAPHAMKTGIHTAPAFDKDPTDRNRTSPFAFTGNKFEFRMLGSSFSIAGINFAINTAVADVLERFAQKIEGGVPPLEVIRTAVAEHGRIIFNGDNYSSEWALEAERRGLLNLSTTVDALPCFLDPKNTALFERHNILTGVELRSRYEILMETYCKTLHVEACTLSQMATREILPAAIAYCGSVSDSALAKLKLLPQIDCGVEKRLAARLSELTAQLEQGTRRLDEAIARAEAMGVEEGARHYRDVVVPAMGTVREAADALEMLVGKGYWPYPTYGELLFSV